MFLNFLVSYLPKSPIMTDTISNLLVQTSDFIRPKIMIILFSVPNASSVLMDMVQEIRDETAWSDQSICGTVQLACAVSFRALAASPVDHLSKDYAILISFFLKM